VSTGPERKRSQKPGSAGVFNSHSRGEAKLLLRTVLAAAAALLSIYFTKLGLFAAVGTFVAWASLPRLPNEELRRERRLLLVAALAASVGLVRFLIVEAIPGIVAGGNRFTEQRAISRLREILFAEDSARRIAAHDPDQDHVGGALLLGELTGELGVRRGNRLPVPLLESYPRQVDTSVGPASEIGGYFLIVCLPKPGGGFTAQPNDAVDEELAERRFIAYAWPSGTAPGLDNAVALDEHEHISLAPAKAGLRYGFAAPPSCDDSVATETRGAWTAWRHKQPRQRLPGDR
jgi:hypothetical protein